MSGGPGPGCELAENAGRRGNSIPALLVCLEPQEIMEKAEVEVNLQSPKRWSPNLGQIRCQGRSSCIFSTQGGGRVAVSSL